MLWNEYYFLKRERNSRALWIYKEELRELNQINPVRVLEENETDRAGPPN